MTLDLSRSQLLGDIVHLCTGLEAANPPYTKEHQARAAYLSILAPALDSLPMITEDEQMACIELKQMIANIVSKVKEFGPGCEDN